MDVSRLVKRGLVRAFVTFGVIAVVLNLMAAAESFQRDLWSMGLGYFAIAAGLTAALAVHWYATHRQVPYNWRDEGWRHERWREYEAEDDDEPDADDWREPSWRT